MATGLAKIHTGGYNGWPFIFFVEGGFTVLFGILTIFFLPHTPAESKFLTEEEKAGAALRMHLDSHGADTADEVKNEKFSKQELAIWSSVYFADFSRLALGEDGLPQLEHHLTLFEFLRHHHTYLFVLAVPAYNYQELGLQGRTCSTSHCTSERGSLLECTIGYMAVRQVPHERPIHVGWLCGRHRGIHNAHLQQPPYDPIRRHFPGRSRSVPLQSAGHGMVG